jgi:hypothetical protein
LAKTWPPFRSDVSRPADIDRLYNEVTSKKGKVNSVQTLYQVIESIKRDTKHEPLRTAPVPTDGPEGSSTL